MTWSDEKLDVTAEQSKTSVDCRLALLSSPHYILERFNFVIRAECCLAARENQQTFYHFYPLELRKLTLVARKV